MRRRIFLGLVMLCLFLLPAVLAQTGREQQVEDDLSMFQQLVHDYPVRPSAGIVLLAVLIAAFLPKLAWKSGLYQQWWWQLLRELFMVLLHVVSIASFVVVLYEWSVLCIDGTFGVMVCSFVSFALIIPIGVMFWSIVRRRSTLRAFMDGLLLFFYGAGSLGVLILSFL